MKDHQAFLANCFLGLIAGCLICIAWTLKDIRDRMPPLVTVKEVAR